MLFPTVDFGLFFSLIFFTSWALGSARVWRKLLLLVASYFFYAMWDWRFLALLAGSSLVNYAVGAALAAYDNDDKMRHRLVVLGVVANLGLLGVFKYFGFFIESLDGMLAGIGWQRDLPIFEIILPVGISFFTFQGISYIVDIYRRDLKAVADPVDLFLFISFFPQLVAGPIVRARDFLPQLNRTPELTARQVSYGFTLILVGLFKKMIVAHYLAADLVDDMFDAPDLYGSGALLFGSYAYAVQVYCDFSAYSDIAIGCALLLGFHFKRNFDRPLAATSLQQLWQRWHISLGGFLRDYLYRPLRGKKKGQGQLVHYRTTFLTMLIGGLWHGAAWTFIIWGGIHGAFLVIENFVRAFWRKRAVAERITGALAAPIANAAHACGLNGAASARRFFALPFGATFGWLCTFHVFALSAIFFRAPDMSVAVTYFQSMGAWQAGEGTGVTPLVFALLVLSVALQFVPRDDEGRDLTERTGDALAAIDGVTLGLLVGLGLLAIFALAPPGVAPFIYFQF